MKKYLGLVSGILLFTATSVFAVDLSGTWIWHWEGQSSGCSLCSGDGPYEGDSAICLTMIGPNMYADNDHTLIAAVRNETEVHMSWYFFHNNCLARSYIVGTISENTITATDSLDCPSHYIDEPSCGTEPGTHISVLIRVNSDPCTPPWPCGTLPSLNKQAPNSSQVVIYLLTLIIPFAFVAIKKRIK